MPSADLVSIISFTGPIAARMQGEEHSSGRINVKVPMSWLNLGSAGDTVAGELQVLPRGCRCRTVEFPPNLGLPRSLDNFKDA